MLNGTLFELDHLFQGLRPPESPWRRPCV